MYSQCTVSWARSRKEPFIITHPVAAYENHSRKRPAPVTDIFFASRGCPLTRASTVLHWRNSGGFGWFPTNADPRWGDKYINENRYTNNLLLKILHFKDSLLRDCGFYRYPVLEIPAFESPRFKDSEIRPFLTPPPSP